MIELEELVKTPWSKEAIEYIKDNEIDINELITDNLYERARYIGIDIIESFLKKYKRNPSLSTESDCIMELLGYQIAVNIVAALNNEQLTNIFAKGVANTLLYPDFRDNLQEKIKNHINYTIPPKNIKKVFSADIQDLTRVI